MTMIDNPRRAVIADRALRAGREHLLVLLQRYAVPKPEVAILAGSVWGLAAGH
jgi:hypothetical protein